MSSETDNPELGTDNAQPSEADNSENWDYYDPDEDNVEEQDEETEDEVEPEADDDQEIEDEAEEKEPEDEQPEPGLVTLADGTQVTHEELVLGYQRQGDYTRKTQEVANERTALAERAQNIERTVSIFTDFLVQQLPEEPDVSLAYSAPEKYTAQKARYDAAISQVQQLFQMAEAPKEVLQGLSKEDHDKLKASEMRKLNAALPKTATSDGMNAFMEGLDGVVQETGFAKEDLKKVMDHRFWVLADLAREGLAARQASKKAKAKAEKAPPVAPRKPPAAKGNNNRDAMKKLTRTGSIHDALAIDF